MKYYTFGNNFPNGGGGDDRWSGVRFWLTTMLVFWAFSAIGLGWLVNSFFILIGFVTVVPVVAFFGLQFAQYDFSLRLVKIDDVYLCNA